MPRCNPYGYATDAGPKHLMGGFYGPEYAGKMTTLADGIHGPAICTRQATIRARMICQRGHQGPIMDLCLGHFGELQGRMSDTCTRCVWGPGGEARSVAEDMDRVMYAMAGARADGDGYSLRRLGDRLEDLRQEMDQLSARGLTPKVPLTLVEIS
jgi:hypothetical protein